MPLVTFVVPAFNAERFLPATVDSIQGQQGVDWDCVIVDDGSTDGTAAMAMGLAAADPRIRVVQQANGGVAAARNTGARRALGDWLCFLDADDVLHRDFVSTLMEGVRFDEIAVYCNGHYIDERGAPSADARFADWSRGRAGSGGAGRHRVERPRMIDGPCIMSPGQMLVRRAHHLQAGGFDEALATAADWDYQVRLGVFGAIVFRDADLFAYRRHASNMSKDTGRARVEFQVSRLKMVRAASAGEERRGVLRIHRRFYTAQARNHSRPILRFGAGAVALAYAPGLWRIWALVVARQRARHARK